MTETELKTENDLWKLFGGEAPEISGNKELTYADFFDLTSVLDISGKKGFRPMFHVSNPDRFYRLRCTDVEAVVNQARLYFTARKIGHPELSVAYLGTNTKR